MITCFKLHAKVADEEQTCAPLAIVTELSVHVQVNKQVGPKVQEFVCLLVRAVNA